MLVRPSEEAGFDVDVLVFPVNLVGVDLILVSGGIILFLINLGALEEHL
jgi:hypothetical protein